MISATLAINALLSSGRRLLSLSHEGERLTVVTHTAAATFTVNRQRPASAALVHTRGSTFGGQRLTVDGLTRLA